MGTLKRSFRARGVPVPSRRMFLRGAAGALALPFLGSVAPAHATTGDIKRLLYVFLPNGMNMPDWTPATEGAGYTLSPTLTPLAAFQSQLMVVSGLSNYGAIAGGEGHEPGTAAFLTCASPDPDVLLNGVSADQLAAQAIVGTTPFSSIEVGVEAGSGVGSCDGGTCAYGRNISWSDATIPRPKVSTPTALFERLFGSSSGTLTPDEADRRRTLRLSVLDHVATQSEQLSLQLGVADRQKLDAYFTSVRELEVQVASLANTACDPLDPPASDLDYPSTVDAYLDLMVKAFECDLTRVQSFMLGNAATNRAYPHIGIPDSHHALSHHGNDPAIRALLSEIDRWEIEHVVAGLLTRLQNTPNATGGTLLDETIVFVSSELSCGHFHDNFDLPVLIAGGGAVFNHGTHLRVDGGALADLHLAVLEGFGVVESTLGHVGMGPLPGVLA